MTVIVTDGKTIAGDGLVACGWTIVALDAVKILRLADGRVFGATGNSNDKHAFAQYMNEGGEKPDSLHEDFSALVVDRKGRILRYSRDCEAIELPAPQAVGCGADIALGAMDAGASVKRAVEIACARSTHCGGSITVLSAKK